LNIVQYLFSCSVIMAGQSTREFMCEIVEVYHSLPAYGKLN
jgi:hypothetical protein